MRKLNFLAICFLSVISFASCTKEDISNGTTNPGTQQPTANYTINSSGWVSASLMSWSDTTIEDKLYVQAMFYAPVTEAMMQHNSILVYAKKDGREDVSVFPATIYDNSSNYELIHSMNTIDGIQIFHTQSVDGIYVRPDVTNTQFRYILIETEVPANGRIEDAGVPPYTISQLQSMTYEEVIAALGIIEK